MAPQLEPPFLPGISRGQGGKDWLGPGEAGGKGLPLSPPWSLAALGRRPVQVGLGGGGRCGC